MKEKEKWKGEKMRKKMDKGGRGVPRPHTEHISISHVTVWVYVAARSQQTHVHQHATWHMYRSVSVYCAAINTPTSASMSVHYSAMSLNLS